MENIERIKTTPSPALSRYTTKGQITEFKSCPPLLQAVCGDVRCQAYITFGMGANSKKSSVWAKVLYTFWVIPWYFLVNMDFLFYSLCFDCQGTPTIIKRLSCWTDRTLSPVTTGTNRKNAPRLPFCCPPFWGPYSSQCSLQKFGHFHRDLFGRLVDELEIFITLGRIEGINFGLPESGHMLERPCFRILGTWKNLDWLH